MPTFQPALDDVLLDFDSGREDTGIFGINLHRASSFNKSVNVHEWSAGYTLLHERDFP